MLTRWDPGWTEFDDIFSAMSELRTSMDRVFEDTPFERWTEGRFLPSLGRSWPRMNLVDGGTSLTLLAEVPGLGEKDIRLNLNQEVLTIEGERRSDAPKGYSTHRQERPALRFSRSFVLPCAVNADRTVATVKDGLLTVTMEKAVEAMPRQITVKAS